MPTAVVTWGWKSRGDGRRYFSFRTPTGSVTFRFSTLLDSNTEGYIPHGPTACARPIVRLPWRGQQGCPANSYPNSSGPASRIVGARPTCSPAQTPQFPQLSTFSISFALPCPAPISPQVVITFCACRNISCWSQECSLKAPCAPASHPLACTLVW